MVSQFRDDDNLNFRDGSASGVIFFCKVYSRLADYFKKKLISSTFEEQVVARGDVLSVSTWINDNSLTIMLCFIEWH